MLIKRITLNEHEAYDEIVISGNFFAITYFYNGENSMMYFICYDITNPKRLKSVAKTLENFGLRVQYSFFQCEMSRSIMEDLRDRLLMIIEPKEDSLRIYPICEDCLKKTSNMGDGNIYEPKTYQIL